MLGLPVNENIVNYAFVAMEEMSKIRHADILARSAERAASNLIRNEIRVASNKRKAYRDNREKFLFNMANPLYAAWLLENNEI